MSKNEALGPALGLDVGTSRIVTARGSAGEYSYEAQLNAFVSIPYSKLTVDALLRESVPCTVEAHQSSFTATRARNSPDC
jgi:hypothetical protein